MGNYYTRQEIKARTIMLARKSLLLALSQFLSLGFGFVSLYFITNNIPNTPQQPYVGNVAAAIAFVGFFGFMMDLGFGTTHIKKVSEGQDEGRCNGTYLAIKAVFTAIYIPLVLVSIWGYETFYMEFEHGHFTELVLIFLGWGILSNVTIACTTIMIAKQEVAKSTMVAVVSGLFQSIITIIVVLATDNLMIFASTWVIGAVVSAARRATDHHPGHARAGAGGVIHMVRDR